MLARIFSVGVKGIDGYAVLVELDMANGLPGYATVGLPDSAVRESRERVTSAVRNSGYSFPSRKITVNLAPAQSRKEGTQFDLPIALAVLSASGQLPEGAWTNRYCFVGELALDGTLRPVPGVLTMATLAKERGFDAIIVPAANVGEARACGLNAYGVSSLREVAGFLNGGPAPLDVSTTGTLGVNFSTEDWADVKGQTLAKRALEIAAAGSHNVILIGPPGVGKSMLARRMPGLLPPLTRGEALEVTRIHSALGRVQGIATQRPFRSPHHSASTVSLIGGGPGARPGEVSLAHGGVLFLDELGEFGRQALEALRQPLEDFHVCIARAKESLTYPARFMLVAATNPCPCGWRGHPQRSCVCTPPAVSKYLSRLSGPLLDRIDIQVELASLPFDEWAEQSSAFAESSVVVRARVEGARIMQRARFDHEDFACNAYIPSRDLRRHCVLDEPGLSVLNMAARRMHLTARSLDRALKVARTIADLADAKSVRAEHLMEALQYRSLDRLTVGML